MFRRERLIFAFTVAGASALLVSIAMAELVLAGALVMWILWRPRKTSLPSFFIPLCAFVAVTLISLIVSPNPPWNWAARKTILFAMTLLAPTFVTTAGRARTAHASLIAVATATSAYGLIQFAMTYSRYLSTERLADDPMILARITGFMGHWLTFSGEQLLVWCAAIPAIVSLGKRWYVPIITIGTALILSFTRGVWAGAIVAVAVVSVMMPKRILLMLLLPLALIAVASSGLIYHRIAASNSQNFMPDAGRTQLWKAGVQMIREHPWFGVGPEKISSEFPRLYKGKDLQNIYYGHLENDFLQIAAERGLICFATFLWFILELYAGLFRLLRNFRPASRWIALSGIASLTGFVVSGFFEYNFGDSEVQLLLLFIVTMPFGVTDEGTGQEIGRSVGLGDFR